MRPAAHAAAGQFWSTTMAKRLCASPQAGEAQPALLRDGGMVRLWHKPDPQFKVPKAVLYLHLQLPGKWL